MPNKFQIKFLGMLLEIVAGHKQFSQEVSRVVGSRPASGVLDLQRFLETKMFSGH